MLWLAAEELAWVPGASAGAASRQHGKAVGGITKALERYSGTELGVGVCDEVQRRSSKTDWV